MLFQFGMAHKLRRGGKVGERLCRFLTRHVVFTSPARQHPFRVFGEPFRGIVLALNQASPQRQILDWTLLGAGGWRTLQTEDEDKRGQWIFLSRDGGRSGLAQITAPLPW
jgi:hypothetical protein